LDSDSPIVTALNFWTTKVLNCFSSPPVRERKEMIRASGMDGEKVRSGLILQNPNIYRCIALEEVGRYESEEQVEQIFKELAFNKDRFPAEPLKGEWA
jgi:hypothetical protein